jgi:hypothetical protein
MDRRKFLRSGSLTGIGLTTIGGWRLAVDRPLNSSIYSEKQAVLDLEEITVTELQKKMQAGNRHQYPLLKHISKE